MGRRKGSKNIGHSSTPMITLNEPVTKKDIHRKMSILFDFGFTQEEVTSLFKDKDFEGLRALDCYTSNAIKKMLAETAV